jgi:hypothetical protein
MLILREQESARATKNLVFVGLWYGLFQVRSNSQLILALMDSSIKYLPST